MRVSSQMKKTASLILLSLIAVILILYVVALKVVAPRILRSQLDDAIHTNCATCEYQIETITFALLHPGRVEFDRIHFKSGIPGGSEFEADFEDVIVTADLFNSQFKSEPNRFILSLLEIDSARVHFTDGDLRSPKKNEEADKNDLTYAVLETQLRNGQFTYVRNTKGTSATLHIIDIDGRIGPIGDAVGLSEGVVEARLRARIEKSGSVELAVATLTRAGPPHIDVTLKIHEQDLGDLTAFFKPNAGVELRGQMMKGASHIEVRGAHLTASVWAQYRGLGVKLDPMYDRSPMKAWAMNIGTELTMNEENFDHPKAAQERSVNATREPGEGIIGFILRGMKEAAIHVAQANK